MQHCSPIGVSAWLKWVKEKRLCLTLKHVGVCSLIGQKLTTGKGLLICSWRWVKHNIPLRSAGWSWRLELEWCERKILLGWLELELVAGEVWEENIVGLEQMLAAERSDGGCWRLCCWSNPYDLANHTFQDYEKARDAFLDGLKLDPANAEMKDALKYRTYPELCLFDLTSFVFN